MWWNQYVGTQFQDGGRGNGAVDCWGLVQRVYKEQLGIDLPSYSEHYENTMQAVKIGALVSEVKMLWDSPDKPAPFDVIILRIRNAPMHVGVVTKAGFMLHCEQDIGAVIEDYRSQKWKNRIVGFARYAATSA